MNELFESFLEITGCSLSVLKSKRRTESLMFYKRVFIRSAYLSDFKKSEIAKYLDYKDHTSVLHHLNVLLTKDETKTVNRIINYHLKRVA